MRFRQTLSLILLAALGAAQAAGVLPVAAQPSPRPLIMVALPETAGDRLAARLEALLEKTTEGYTVRRHMGPVQSEEAAVRAGRYFQAALVVWAAPDTPDVLYNTTIQQTIAPVDVLTAPFAVPQGSGRSMLAYLHTTTGQALAIAGVCGPALTRLEDALQTAPENWTGLAEVYYYRGTCSAVLGQMAQAQPDFAMAASLLPEAWYAWHALAWAAFNLNDADMAFTAVDESITLQPGIGALFADRAYFHSQLGDFSAALADANRAVDLLPEDPNMRLRRAETYTALGDYTAALEDVNAGLTLNPIQPDPYLFQRGLLHLYMNTFDAAVPDLEQYTGLRPEDPAGWINLGQAYEGLGQTFSAIQAYETALATAPEASYLYTSLARLYYEGTAAFSPESAQAEEYLHMSVDAASTALDAFAADATALLYRGMARLALGETIQALEDFSTALDINPELDAALYNRAVITAEMAESALDRSEQERLYRAAIADYADLLRLDFASYGYLLPTVGGLYVELGHYADAVEHFAAYDELYPGMPISQQDAIYRGRAYHALDSEADAVAAYANALEGEDPRLACEALLISGLLEGRTFQRYALATERLAAFLDRSCAGGPLERTGVTLVVQGWQAATLR